MLENCLIKDLKSIEMTSNRLEPVGAGLNYENYQCVLSADSIRGKELAQPDEFPVKIPYFGPKMLNNTNLGQNYNFFLNVLYSNKFLEVVQYIL